MKHITFVTILVVMCITTYFHLKSGPRLMESRLNGQPIQIWVNGEVSRITIDNSHHWGKAEFDVWNNSVHFKSDSIEVTLTPQ